MAADDSSRIAERRVDMATRLEAQRAARLAERDAVRKEKIEGAGEESLKYPNMKTWLEKTDSMKCGAYGHCTGSEIITRASLTNNCYYHFYYLACFLQKHNGC